MTHVRSALARVADLADPAHLAPGAVDADLARGRRALRRRRAAQGAGTLVVVAATAGVVRAAAPSTGSPQFVAPSPATASASASSEPTVEPTTPTPTATRYPTVPLVAYDGRQQSGYQVAYVPKGWEIQGGTAFALVIAPVGFADQRIDSFEGKLVVMLRSSDDKGEPVGTPVEVGNGTGYVNRQEESYATVLTYKDRRGNWVQVQVPPTLGWTDKEIARFGEGVVVTRKAEPGLG